jgi:outer membrane protein assembly factor BamE (lipoprotein component of BamABCDE complex)
MTLHAGLAHGREKAKIGAGIVEFEGMTTRWRPVRPANGWNRSVKLVAAILLAATAGCASNTDGENPNGGIGQTSQHGYMVSPLALEQIPPGSSKDQVLIALGSPSTTAEFGGDVFYYISQTRYRPVAFMPDKIVDQRVIAVYFDDKDQVERVANYGLKDGVVFDFISRTTPTGGADSSFISQVFAGVLGTGGGK